MHDLSHRCQHGRKLAGRDETGHELEGIETTRVGASNFTHLGFESICDDILATLSPYDLGRDLDSVLDCIVQITESAIGFTGRLDQNGVDSDCQHMFLGSTEKSGSKLLDDPYEPVGTEEQGNLADSISGNISRILVFGLEDVRGAGYDTRDFVRGVLSRKSMCELDDAKRDGTRILSSVSSFDSANLDRAGNRR